MMHTLRIEELKRQLSESNIAEGDVPNYEWHTKKLLHHHERMDGWHFCPEFDGLLTQGEGTTQHMCSCGRLQPFLYTFEEETYRVFAAIHCGHLHLDYVYDGLGQDMVPPDEIDIRDFPEHERVLTACFAEAKRRYGSFTKPQARLA